MASKSLHTDDLVWAKMKGYSPWPGKIMALPEDMNPKKNHHYIYFFGSQNCAWVVDDCIELHSEELIEKYGKKKGENFQKAVQTIIEESGGTSKVCDSPIEDVETEGSKKLIKITNGNTKGNTSLKYKRKFSFKTVKRSIEKKPTRKYGHFPRQKAQNSENDGSDDSSTFSNVVAGSSLMNLDSLSLIPTIDNSALPQQTYVNRPKTPPIDLCKSKFLKSKKIRPTNKIIGFLGLDKIGQAIFKNLCHSGHKVIIWYKTPDECKTLCDGLKVKIVATPAEVVKAADITFCYICDQDIAKEVISEVLTTIEQSKERKCFVDLSSRDPELSQITATEIKMKGGWYLEAPLCGSRIEADKGTLLIQAAGDKMLYDDCKSCFDAISTNHMFATAEVGSASKLNLIHSMLIGTVHTALAESLSVITKAGLDGEAFIRILKEYDHLSSDHVLQKATAMVEKNYVTDIPLKQMQQDFSLGLELGQEVSQRTTLFANTHEVLKRCMSMNYGDHDISAVFEGTK